MPKPAPTQQLAIDVEEVRRALDVLVAPGQTVELRALDVTSNSDRRPYTVFGYFNDSEQLIKNLSHIEKAKGIYITLNPVQPDLLARSANRTKRAQSGQSAADSNVLVRRWLPIDLDPKRPAGISASNAERDHAFRVAGDIRAVLDDLGWPAPLFADSGNGVHLLYRIDLPSDDGGLLQRVLQGLAFRFSNDDVEVDQKTFNPSRIWKLYGTIARKGDHVDDRPHRLARILEVPESIQLVTQDQLHEVAGWGALPTPDTERKRDQYQSTLRLESGFDIDAWIERHELDVDGPLPWQNGRKWIFRTCPWNDEHNDRAAYILQLPNGALAAGCHHNGCTGNDWHSLRELLEPGHAERMKGLHLVRSLKPGQDDELEWESPVPFADTTLPPFPTEALPIWLREYVEAVAESTQTPPDLSAMLALSVLSAACAGRFELEARPDWREPLNLYTVTVLPPGNRKSSVLEHMVRPLREWEKQLIEEARPLEVEYRSQRQLLEEKHKAAIAAAAKAQEEDSEQRSLDVALLAHLLDELRRPVSPRLLADDVSMEQATALLAEQGGRLAIFSAEGDLFDILTGRYSKGTAANFGPFLKAHAGEEVRVDRVSRESLYVPSPAITIGLTVQPEVLRGLEHTGRLRGRGLLARILYSWPESMLGRRNAHPQPVPANIGSEYREMMLALMPTLDMLTGDDAREVNVLRLAPDAAAYLHEVMQEVERELSPTGSLGWMTDWGGKLVGANLRIAGLLHMALLSGKRQPWATLVKHSTLEKAVAIGNYLTQHARKTYGEIGADPKIEDARYLLAKIEQSGVEEISRRDLHGLSRGRFRKVTDLDPGLALLVEHGYLRPMNSDPRRGPGRRPSPVYEVNPFMYDSGVRSVPRQTSQGRLSRVA